MDSDRRGPGRLRRGLPALVTKAGPRDKTGMYNALFAMSGAIGGAVFKLSFAAFRDETAMTQLGGLMAIWVICAAVFLTSAVLMMLVKLDKSEEAQEALETDM